MNYYEILNVKKDASSKEIRQSYKALMKKYHPDIFKGDKAKAEKLSMEINAAYDVLSNPEARKEYDLSLEEENINNTNYNSSESTENTKQYYTSSTKNTYTNYNPYSYENYRRKKYYEDKSSYNYNNYSNTYNSHIKSAENYVSNKIDSLKTYQKVLIFFIFLLFSCILILITFIEYLKVVPGYTNNKEKLDITYPNNFNFVNNIDTNSTKVYLTEEEFQRKLFESIYGY